MKRLHGRRLRQGSREDLASGVRGSVFTAGGCGKDRGEIWRLAFVEASSRQEVAAGRLTEGRSGVRGWVAVCELHGRVFPAAATAASTVNLGFWL